MIKHKRKVDLKPFDRSKLPPRQNPFILLFLWLQCFIKTRGTKLTIKKIRMKGLKPPFLVLGTHHSFTDFDITPLALFPHRANYVSELEGFEMYGERFYRMIGCLGTRKFVNDLELVKNLKKVVLRGDIIVIYPEARYANVGTSSQLPESLGKLCKYLDVPVVTLNMKGNYLQSPIWNLKRRKGVKLATEIEQLYTRSELREKNAQEINADLKIKLAYDEYEYQKREGLEIKTRTRAEGLENPLYKCPKCLEEKSMVSQGSTLICTSCQTQYQMDYYGSLSVSQGDFKDFKFSHLPNWYEWERKVAIDELISGHFEENYGVEVESLPNGKNFLNLGTGKLKHTSWGFTLEIGGETLTFKHHLMGSIHNEYDYRGLGPCIVLSTLDNSYFIFSKDHHFNVTKIQFIVEYFSQKPQV